MTTAKTDQTGKQDNEKGHEWRNVDIVFADGSTAPAKAAHVGTAVLDDEVAPSVDGTVIARWRVGLRDTSRLEPAEEDVGKAMAHMALMGAAAEAEPPDLSCDCYASTPGLSDTAKDWHAKTCPEYIRRAAASEALPIEMRHDPIGLGEPFPVPMPDMFQGSPHGCPVPMPRLASSPPDKGHG